MRYLLLMMCGMIGVAPINASDDLADEPNLVVLPTKEFCEQVSQLYDLPLGSLKVSADNDQLVDSFNFLVGEQNTRSPERLSKSYKKNLDLYKKNGGIPSENYFNLYKIVTKNQKKSLVNIKWKKQDGWGYGTTSIIEEIFLLTGDIKQATPYIRITPKKTISWYEKVYNRLFPNSKNTKIQKIDNTTWVLTYSQLSLDESEDEEVIHTVSRIYFEEFGKTLTLVFSIDQIEKVDIIATSLAKKILASISEKGIYPDENVTYFFRQRRSEKLKSPDLPFYVDRCGKLG